MLIWQQKFIVRLAIILGVALYTAAGAAFANSCSSSGQKISRDLTCLQAGQLYTLGGQWRFLPNQAPANITDEFLSQAGWQQKDILSDWRAHGKDPNRAKGTYRLDLRLDKPASNIFMRTPEGYSAIRMFIKDAGGAYVRIHQTIDDEGFAAFRTGRISDEVIQLPPLGNETTLILQLANGPYYKGHIFRLPMIGKLQELQEHVKSGYKWGLVAIGALIVMVLINVSLWLANRRILAQLVLGIIIMIAGIRLLDTWHLIHLFSTNSSVMIHTQIGWYTMYAGVIAMSAFIRLLLPDFYHIRFFQLVVVTTAIAALAAATLPSEMLLQVGRIYRFIALLFILYSAYAVFQAIFAQDRINMSMLFGVIFICATAFYDAIVQMAGRDSNTMNWGILIFLLAQTIYFNRHYVSALQRSRNLADNLEAEVTERTQELNDLNQKLTYLAQTDSLTGLPNRRAFASAYELELKSGADELHLSLIDVDHFKMVNDTYGHDTGDEALIYIAERIKKCLRKGDHLARIGGEEFALLLRTHSTEECREKLNEIKRAISGVDFVHKDIILELTISIGFTSVKKGRSYKDVMKAADEALYKAKNAGRNQVSQFMR